jgi:hypothetical protein
MSTAPGIGHNQGPPMPKAGDPKPLEQSIIAAFKKHSERAVSVSELMTLTGGSRRDVIKYAKKYCAVTTDAHLYGVVATDAKRHRTVTTYPKNYWDFLTGPGQDLQFYNRGSDWSMTWAAFRSHPPYARKSDDELKALPEFYDAVQVAGTAWLLARPQDPTSRSFLQHWLCKDTFTVSPFARLINPHILADMRERWQQRDHANDEPLTAAAMARDLKYEREEAPDLKFGGEDEATIVPAHDAFDTRVDDFEIEHLLAEDVGSDAIDPDVKDVFEEATKPPARRARPPDDGDD